MDLDETTITLSLLTRRSFKLVGFRHFCTFEIGLRQISEELHDNSSPFLYRLRGSNYRIIRTPIRTTRGSRLCSLCAKVRNFSLLYIFLLNCPINNSRDKTN